MSIPPLTNPLPKITQFQLFPYEPQRKTNLNIHLPIYLHNKPISSSCPILRGANGVTLQPAAREPPGSIDAAALFALLQQKSTVRFITRAAAISARNIFRKFRRAEPFFRADDGPFFRL